MVGGSDGRWGREGERSPGGVAAEPFDQEMINLHCVHF